MFNWFELGGFGLYWNVFYFSTTVMKLGTENDFYLHLFKKKNSAIIVTFIEGL